MNADEIVEKIKECETMRSLDDLRIDIIKTATCEDDFEKMQNAFINKKNSLKRKGHTRWREGYELMDAIHSGTESVKE